MKTVLIGGGGHARSIAETMGADMFHGYCALEKSSIPFGVPYLGPDSVLNCLTADDTAIHIAIGFGPHGSLSLRRKIIDSLAHLDSETLVAPTAIVTDGCSIGKGTAVFHRTVINRAYVGSHCVVNTGAIIEHDCVLDENVFIGPGAILCGEVHIGRDVFIGAGAIIKQGISICSGAVIGMAAVVTHNITEPGIYTGNPIKKIS